MHDVVIVGGGPAGLMAAVAAAGAGASVLVLEGGPRPGRKLLASGGGRCNVTNTLPAGEFMNRCGRFGRFMQPSLEMFGSDRLRSLLLELDVETHAPDGFHVFPTDHNARSVLDALVREVQRLGAEIRVGSPVVDLVIEDGIVGGVRTADTTVPSKAVILACGGCGYPSLGGTMAGCDLAAACGHRLVPAHPGMVPLLTREDWPATCTADTVPRATLSIRRPGKPRITGNGDLIFTRDGLAGPVVLDLAREVTPLLAAHGEMVMDLELTGRDQSRWLADLTTARAATPRTGIGAWLQYRGNVPQSLGKVFCDQVDVDSAWPLERLGRGHLNALATVLARIQVTLIGDAGWDRAMVMRGGVSLRDVRPETLESRHVGSLYLAGEMLDLDGPCGGFNLQWAFASGHLAGSSASAR